MARKTTDNTAELFEQFQAFLAMRAAQDEKPDEQTTEKPATRVSRSSKPATPRGRKAAEINAEQAAAKRGPSPKRTLRKGVITCGEAWQALGADPTYTPRDPNAPARNAQLWALNAQGKLRLA